MKIELSQAQRERQTAFKAFVEREIAPNAAACDRQERLPDELIAALSRQGYLGALLPGEYGGMDLDVVTYGLLCQELGRGCPAAGLLVNVQAMVGQAIQRWGSESQRERWLKRLATGETLAAFALSEPQVGSDARNVETIATTTGESYLLNGRKQWISFGQAADLFLVFAQNEGEPCAFLVERGTPGLEVEPISGLLGLRACMLAALHLEDCRLEPDSLLGGPGFGFSPVAVSALDLGRYSVAWLCVGLAQACLEASLRFAGDRQQFGAYIKDHQLIRRMITDMVANTRAARLLCYQAGYLREKGDPGALLETMIAKYFAASMVAPIASDAVQIHGARGVSGDYPVERYLRDARIMDIIEGSAQILQTHIAGQIFNEFS